MIILNRRDGKSGTPLSEFAAGTLIKIPENNQMVDFYLAKHDYESSLNGPGRTLVVRKDTYDTRAWDSGNVNAYASSDIDAWFNGTYKNLLGIPVDATKFYYTPGNGNWTVSTLERAIFALSLTELGKSDSYANKEGSAFPIAPVLQIAHNGGNTSYQWTRTPRKSGTNSAFNLTASGGVNYNKCTFIRPARPAFTLPSDLPVDPDTMEVIA